MADPKAFTNRMLKFFRLFPKDDGRDKTFTPAQVNKQKHTINPMQFPERLQRLYDQYMSECMDTRKTLEERFGRYRDLEYCYYNSAIFSTAVDLYADETVQSDAQSQYLTVYAKDKEVERYINNFFTRIGLTQQVLRSAAFDLCLYADHFWVHTLDPEKGIVEITPIDVFAVKDRIEFNALKTIHNSAAKKEYEQILSKSEVLRMLRDSLSDDPEDYSSYFKNYLFGYELDGKIVVPPWCLTHFRRLSSHSEFSPFGRPLMINAIAPYRKYQSSMNLAAIARNANFPIKKFEVHTDSKMPEMDQMEKVNEAMNEYHNAANSLAYKETSSPETEIWTASGLISFDLFNPNIDLGNVADIDMLRDDLIIATRIPKGYLLPDHGTFGVSGQSLLQQSKLTGRAVYSVQTALLEELTNLVRMQFAITGDYRYDEEFEISMNFPVIEQTNDQIRQKSDTLALADDVLRKLASIMGIDPAGIPYDVARGILSKISFLSPDDIDAWLGSMYNVKKDKLIQGTGDLGSTGGASDMGFGSPTGGFSGGFGSGGDMSFGENGAGEGLGANESPSFEGAMGDEPVSGKGILASVGDSLDKFSAGESPEEIKDSYSAGEGKRLSEKKKIEQRIREKVKHRLNEEIVREVYFKQKSERRMDEAIIGKRHVLASFAITPYQKNLLETITKWRNGQGPSKLKS